MIQPGDRSVNDSVARERREMIARTKPPCPTCERDLWHVGHVCYTYADLRARRAAAARHVEPVAVHRIGSNYCGPCGGGQCEEVL